MAPPLTSEYGEDFYDRRDDAAAANELGTERNDLDEDSGDNDSQAGSLDNVNVDNVEIDPNMEAVQILSLFCILFCIFLFVGVGRRGDGYGWSNGRSGNRWGAVSK